MIGGVAGGGEELFQAALFTLARDQDRHFAVPIFQHFRGGVHDASFALRESGCLL